MIPRLLFFLILFSGSILKVFATHIRGGEITFERVPNNQLAVRCTLNIYRDTNSNVQDPTNELFFGDGTSQVSPHINPVISLTGKSTQVYTYYFEHTYSSFGVYTMYHFRNFRNSTVNNIGPNPDQVNFYIETRLVLVPQLDINGPNRSPRLDKPAVDLAKLGYKYFYNPAAYDPDGDSLSYQIIPSRTFFNNIGVSPIANYQLPEAYAGGRDSANLGPARLSIDEKTGDMTWDVPNRVGEYNVAIKIIEWRYGAQIGFVVRDMQIIVRDVNNRPPYLTLPQDTCIEGGDAVIKNITAQDPDSLDLIAIYANGGVFRNQPPRNPAVFTFPMRDGVPVPQRQPAIGRFSWQTVCEDVAREPYVVVFTAEDNKPREIQLTDVKSWTIQVIGPKPAIRNATALDGSIRVSWDPYICQHAIAKFEIYRKEAQGPDFDTCQAGIPDGSGYTMIGNASPTDTSFIDNNSGLGLKFGIVYCYRIVAIFPESKGGKSRPSEERCSRLDITVPLITNVSVERTDSLNGKIFVKWTRPFELDTAANPGPYQYSLKRTSAEGSQAVEIFRSDNLMDTTFLDSAIDTKGKLYSYQVALRINPTPNGKDSSFPAHNINLQGGGSRRSVALSWSADVPWNNAGFYHLIYKFNEDAFDLLDSIVGQVTTTYVDDGTKIPFAGDEENKWGRYFVVTRGAYSEEIFRDTLINKSYELTVFLTDSTPPCPPADVQIQNVNLSCPSCEEYLAMEVRANRLAWSAPVDTCRTDIASYNIYYKQYSDDPFQKIFTTTDTFFVHLNNGSMAGCYKVTTADLSGNEVLLVDSVCNDNCVYFDLPNIFSPNGDAVNQRFTPICATSDLIEDANIAVFNRWGMKVFSGGKEELTAWDGRHKADGSLLPEGTYFYRADVRFKRLNRNDEHRNFKGWVEIVR